MKKWENSPEYRELESAHDARIEHKRRLRERIEMEMAVQSEVMLVREAEAAARAHRVGVPKSKIGRAMGTQNWGTIQAAILRGEEILGEVAVEESKMFVSFTQFFPDSDDFLFFVEAADFPGKGDIDRDGVHHDGWRFLVLKNGADIQGGYKVPVEVREFAETAAGEMYEQLTGKK